MRPFFTAWDLTTAARSGQRCRGPCWRKGQGPGPPARPHHQRRPPPPFSRLLFPPPEAPPRDAATQAPPPDFRRARAEVTYPRLSAPGKRVPVVPGRLSLEAAVAKGELASGLGATGRRALAATPSEKAGRSRNGAFVCSFCGRSAPRRRGRSRAWGRCGQTPTSVLGRGQRSRPGAAGQRGPGMTSGAARVHFSRLF